MLSQRIIRSMNALLLSHTSSIEGDLLRFATDAGDLRAVDSLESCLNGGELAEGRSDGPEDVCGGSIVLQKGSSACRSVPKSSARTHDEEANGADRAEGARELCGEDDEVKEL